MNKTEIKKKLKFYAPEIIAGSVIVIGFSVVYYALSKREADEGNPIFGEIIGDSSTGEPRHFLTKEAVYDIVPRLD